VVREELLILASCLLRPMRRNSEICAYAYQFVCCLFFMHGHNFSESVPNSRIMPNHVYLCTHCIFAYSLYDMRNSLLFCCLNYTRSTYGGHLGSHIGFHLEGVLRTKQHRFWNSAFPKLVKKRNFRTSSNKMHTVLYLAT